MIELLRNDEFLSLHPYHTKDVLLHPYKLRDSQESILISLLSIIFFSLYSPLNNTLNP